MAISGERRALTRKAAGTTTRGAAALALAAALGAGGCATLHPACRVERRVAELAAEEVDATLFLVGDAGAPGRHEVVMRALFRAVSAAARERGGDRVAVVFLGDNSYSSGPAGEPDGRRRLRAQVEAVAGTAARAVFVPGNHDWGPLRDRREERLAEQAAVISELAQAAGVDARYLPPPGSSGPATMAVGDGLWLVAVDSERWLEGEAGPAPAAELAAAVAAAHSETGERRVVIVSHHPLRSGGPHGGHFGWRRHLFPLTDALPGAWLPLPGVGSLYPLARRLGASPQDLTSRAYERMVAAAREALRGRPPLAWAAGHEHTLQVIADPGGWSDLVSGAGSPEKPEPLAAVPGSRFCAPGPGWLRLDLAEDGRARVEAVEVDRVSGAARAVYSGWLGPRPTIN